MLRNSQWHKCTMTDRQKAFWCGDYYQYWGSLTLKWSYRYFSLYKQLLPPQHFLSNPTTACGPSVSVTWCYLMNSKQASRAHKCVAEYHLDFPQRRGLHGVSGRCSGLSVLNPLWARSRTPRLSVALTGPPVTMGTVQLVPNEVPGHRNTDSECRGWLSDSQSCPASMATCSNVL